MNSPLELQPEKNLPARTRGWLLVVTSSFAIVASGLLRYFQSDLQLLKIATGPIILGIALSLSNVIGMVCCMWLGARRTAFFDKEKWIALVILLSSSLLPYIAISSSFYRFREYEFARIFLPAILLTIGFDVLNLVGFAFFSRLTGLHLVSHNATRQPKRLSIRFFFLASFFLAIPLALQIWIRKFVSMDSTSVYQSELFAIWLIRDLLELAFCGTFAMVYANFSWVNRIVATLFFVTNCLVSLLSHFQSLSKFSAEGATNALDRTFYTNLFAMQFLSKYLFLVLAIWLIYRAGYRWRIARRGVGFSQEANSSLMEINPLDDD